MLSGDLDWGSGLGSRGTYGYFWSSTPYTYTNSRRLTFRSANVTPKGGDGKPYGFTLRCVAQQKSSLLFHPNTFSELSPALQILRFVSSRALRSLPLSVIMSGNLSWNSGYPNNRGAYGFFWASTLYSYTHSRSSGFYSINVNSKSNGVKPGGLALRCVALTFRNFHPRSKFRVSLHDSFQSSPQPSSFGYDVGRLRLGQW